MLVLNNSLLVGTILLLQQNVNQWLADMSQQSAGHKSFFFNNIVALHGSAVLLQFMKHLESYDDDDV